MSLGDTRYRGGLVDVSAHQPVIGWPRVAAAGFAGAVLKASEGVGFADSRYERHREAAGAAGLPTGAYHYARPDTQTAQNDALAEADWFLHVARPQPGDLLPALDLETTGLPPAELAAWALAWLRRIERAIRRRPLLYTYPSFYTERLGARGRALAAHSLLWLAAWGPNDGLPHPVSPIGAWRRIALHQFTSRGSVPGIAGLVDLNRLGPGLALDSLRLARTTASLPQSPSSR